MVGQHLAERIHHALRRCAWLYSINARVRALTVRAKYRSLCRRYSSGCVLDKTQLALWGERYRSSKKTVISARKNRRFIYISTSLDQDNAGLLDGLRSHGEVVLFAGPNGRNCLEMPRRQSDYERCRDANGMALMTQMSRGFTSRKPTAVVGQMWNFCMPANILGNIRMQGVPVVNIAMDDRHSFHKVSLKDGSDGGVAGFVGSISLALTAAPECVAWYNHHGVPALFWPEASSPQHFKPMNVEKKYDITFVGANYGYRSEVVAALAASGIKVETRGSGWPQGRIATEDIPRLFAESKIVLGIGGILHCTDFTALKMRDFDAPMSGSFYIAQSNPDLSACFDLGRELVTWSSLPDLVSKCRFYLENESEREKIAKLARVRSMRDHTWGIRFGEMITALENLKP